MSEIEQGIVDMKKLYDSSDICRVCAYKPENWFFRMFPPKLKVLLPKFISHQIDSAEMNKQFEIKEKIG